MAGHPEPLAGLHRCQPADLLAHVAQRLRADLDAHDVALYLVDYRQAVLNRIGANGEVAETVRIDGTVVGRAFAAQAVVSTAAPGGTGAVAYVPVSARGDRLGVLSLRLARPASTQTQDRLTDFAEALGHELLAATRTTDLFTVARRSRPLTLAAELQWQLLPGGSLEGPGFSVAGQLEPAYSVAGDAFDWSVSGGQLLVSVCDGPGRGVTAALVTTLAVTAVRNARRLGAELTDHASLADQAVFAEYGGERFVSALLLSLDTDSGLVQAVDAGSPRLLRIRANQAEPLQLEPQLPLGMFEETRYETEEFQLEPGDRLVVLSDGAAEASDPSGASFHDTALERAIRECRLLPCGEAVRTIMRALTDHRRDEALKDDAVVLCIDWRRGSGQ